MVDKAEQAARTRPVRPRAAASLIALWAQEPGHSKVLMGRRHPDLAFMPNVMVFPGGRVESADASTSPKLDNKSVDTLALEGLEHASIGALAQCALRESFEETGYALSDQLRAPLLYVGRAITPPRFAKRYDTRFLLAHLAADERPNQLSHADGELQDTAWHDISDLHQASLHPVTRAMLQHAASGSWKTDRRPLLITDRTPRGWKGRKALRSSDLRTRWATIDNSWNADNAAET